jgi:hypothetical protein
MRCTAVVTKEVETIGEVARTPGIYAKCGGERVGRGWVAYVGIASNLHRRLEQHVTRRDSSVVTGTSAVGVNVDHVRYIDWWTCDLLRDDEARHAAELIAFEVLEPALRSRGRPREAALTLAADDSFIERVREILTAPPAGRLILPTLAGLSERVRELETRLAAIERRHP